MATKSPSKTPAPKAAPPLTVKQICAVTGRTEMTVYNWRRGSARVTPIPHVVQQRGARHVVLFPRVKFLAWAKEHGVEVDQVAFAKLDA